MPLEQPLDDMTRRERDLKPPTDTPTTNSLPTTFFNRRTLITHGIVWSMVGGVAIWKENKHQGWRSAYTGAFGYPEDPTFPANKIKPIIHNAQCGSVYSKTILDLGSRYKTAELKIEKWSVTFKDILTRYHEAITILQAETGQAEVKKIIKDKLAESKNGQVVLMGREARYGNALLALRGTATDLDKLNRESNEELKNLLQPEDILTLPQNGKFRAQGSFRELEKKFGPPAQYAIGIFNVLTGEQWPQSVPITIAGPGESNLSYFPPSIQVGDDHYGIVVMEILHQMGELTHPSSKQTVLDRLVMLGRDDNITINEAFWSNRYGLAFALRGALEIKNDDLKDVILKRYDQLATLSVWSYLNGPNRAPYVANLLAFFVQLHHAGDQPGRAVVEISDQTQLQLIDKEQEKQLKDLTATLVSSTKTLNRYQESSMRLRENILKSQKLYWE